MALGDPRVVVLDIDAGLELAHLHSGVVAAFDGVPKRVIEHPSDCRPIADHPWRPPHLQRAAVSADRLSGHLREVADVDLLSLVVDGIARLHHLRQVVRQFLEPLQGR